MTRQPLTPKTEPVGPDGFTLRERSWLREAVKHLAELNDLLAERGSERRFGVGPHTPPPMSADGPAPLWLAARMYVAWLDDANGIGEHETAMRLMKLTEEAGEVTQAYIGTVGQNPRKGVTHKREDVAAELCDVIMTAAVALHRFSDNPERTLNEHATRLAQHSAQHRLAALTDVEPRSAR